MPCQGQFQSALSLAPLSNGAPRNSSPPTITGIDPYVGTAWAENNAGGWLGDPTDYEYRWRRDTSVISGATSNSYTLTEDDVGSSVTMQKRALNEEGASPWITASPNINVQVVPIPICIAAPVANGPDSVVGTEWEMTIGQWMAPPAGPTSFEYRWLRNGTPIDGATTDTYTLANDDAGTVVTGQIKGINTYGESDWVSAVPTITVEEAEAGDPPGIVSAAIISVSNPHVGLTISRPTAPVWDGTETSTRRQWEADNGSGYAEISGATGTTLNITEGLLGSTIRLVEYASNDNGEASSSSNVIGPITYVPVGSVGTVTPTSTGTGIALAWSTVTGADAIKVYRLSEPPAGPISTNLVDYTLLATLAGDATSYSDNTAVVQTAYAYLVQAIGEGLDTSEAEPVAGMHFPSTLASSLANVDYYDTYGFEFTLTHAVTCTAQWTIYLDAARTPGTHVFQSNFAAVTAGFQSAAYLAIWNVTTFFSTKYATLQYEYTLNDRTYYSQIINQSSF